MMGDVHLDHVHLRVRDLDASRRFYVAVAEALEFGPIKAGDGWFELGELFVSADGPVTTNLHFAFKAPDRSSGRALLRGRSRGRRPDNGAPGYRPRYHRGYYAAYVLDPDGNNVEAVVHERVECHDEGRLVGGLLRNNPAASYSPGGFRPEYHRRWRA